MEKQKKWHFFLILAVITLTIYHILPTVFYYCKPLKKPITESEAIEISRSISARVNELEDDSKQWLVSFCKLLSIKPESIQSANQNFTITFSKAEEATRFQKFLPQAGSLIQFIPAQLGLSPAGDLPKQVKVQRRIPLSLDESFFSFAKIDSPLYKEIILDRVSQISYALTGAHEAKENVHIGSKNPIFSEISVNWADGHIYLKLHPHIASQGLTQPLIDEVAKVSQKSGETLHSSAGFYKIAIHNLANPSGYLALDLKKIAKVQEEEILSELKSKWHPKHPDLQTLQIVSERQFDNLPPTDQALSLVVHVPNRANPSFYITCKGLNSIYQNYRSFPNSELAAQFNLDFQALASLLQSYGFQAYPTQNEEIVFEKLDFAYSLLMATREDFRLLGSKKYALLELTNLEQRQKTLNRIDTEIHEDLCKARDEYIAAQVSMQPGVRFTAVKPTKNTLWSNFVLSWTKYFRGDENRVIHWGLDLSGGKSVQIELRDANGKLVTEENDLKQGINELYNRVNKMGVSEVAIRRHGNTIVLDFPGSQTLSASELIKASSMYFHIVNEKFASHSSSLSGATQKFLSEVWNEAIVTNKKDSRSINEIAYEHLHGEKITESARTLKENGLCLQDPKNPKTSHTVDTTESKIALIRGDKWFGQSHPLLLVFSHYALEGSQLDRIQANYDPQKGNYLSFDVKGSARDSLYAWTSRYAKEKVQGTSLEEFSQGQGWRMAVILNDSVLSAPTLDGLIRDSASISGSFSQREVNHLAADLKAGSLTFTPHILSEKNVSPELGEKDRAQGIGSTIVALFLVVISMIAYYRFAGLIASVAVLFNLLILWGVLQNLGATLSLAGIAGIILTVGMAVDANVLVFERIKEEFNLTQDIRSAIHAGYKKAYSAIIDSNVTTIIAALILLNFDAGPVKGFAITLIIGIASSMFTALFMTRFYFNHWLQNPKNQALTMANWIQAKSIDFLKQSNRAFAIATAVILLGCALVFTQRATIFGMDFTGGSSLQIELATSKEGAYLSKVEKAFTEKGMTQHDFQIRELNPSNQLRVLFATSVELEGKPFYKMPIEQDGKNPRIEWVISALKDHGLNLTPASLAKIEKDWVAMSGQMSDSMRNNALLGLLLSLICIFIYISFRFEYKFAAAAIICLLHDVLITIGLIGILHLFGVPVQIDLNTVAAIMTIVGYSLNDTIIVFDRIREEMLVHRNRSLVKIVNAALNTTLSRTTITSGTTLLVLLALVILGGPSIFSFALVMTLGVFFGTLSSWYIAAPLMLLFHKREEKSVKFVVEG